MDMACTCAPSRTDARRTFDFLTAAAAPFDLTLSRNRQISGQHSPHMPWLFACQSIGQFFALSRALPKQPEATWPRPLCVRAVPPACI